MSGKIYEDGKIEIEYGVMKNEKRDDWYPVIWVNSVLNSYEGWNGLSLEEADIAAKKLAEEEASRYCGDWDITIEKRHVLLTKKIEK